MAATVQLGSENIEYLVVQMKERKLRPSSQSTAMQEQQQIRWRNEIFDNGIRMSTMLRNLSFCMTRPSEKLVATFRRANKIFFRDFSGFSLSITQRCACARHAIKSPL